MQSGQSQTNQSKQTPSKADENQIASTTISARRKKNKSPHRGEISAAKRTMKDATRPVGAK